MTYNELSLENQEDHVAKLSLLEKISTIIPHTENINVITNRVLSLATEYTKAEKGSVMILNENGELCISAASHIDTQLMRKYKVKIGEGIAGEVAERREPVLITDIESDKRFRGNRSSRYKTKSFISCPIVIKNRLLGLININDKKDKSPFTEGELMLIKIVADQSAVALEHAFLVDQIKTKAKEIEELDRNLIGCEVSGKEFIARISHKLRTPLNSIRGAVYYLQKSQKLSYEKQKEFFDIISNETTNLISIIEGHLDFLRAEDTIETSQGTVINIAELLNETANSKSLREIFLKKNIKLDINTADMVFNIVGDRIRIRQFFLNLLEVLSFYLENRDSITISIGGKDGIEIKIRLSRRMPDAVLSHLLDERRLFDFDRPSEMIKLYLAKKVAQYHRWNLNMRNNHSASYISIRVPENPVQKREVMINTALAMFVEFISEILELEICSVMLFDDLTGALAIRSSKGLSHDIIKMTKVKSGDRISGKVAFHGKPLFVKNIEKDLYPGGKNIPQYNSNSFISLPIKMQNRLIGVINLSNKRNAEPFTTAEFWIASLMCERLSYFIEKFSSDRYLETYFKQFIKSFESLLTILKKYHKKQSIDPELMIKIMDAIGVSEEDKRVAMFVSLLYDLGLMLIDDDIFYKKHLSPSEATSVKLHPYNTVFLLDTLELSDEMKKIILYHHERFDGTGYPSGLKGEEIPLLSRVLSVVDSFSAMLSERPYRERLTKEQALKEIRAGAGSLYDPNVVTALEEIITHIN